jgi:hypothetical protein
MNKSFRVCSKLCTHELQEAGSTCIDLPAGLLLLLLVFSSGYVAPKGWKVIFAIREAQHDPANYENPKQFNPWHHGQVHHSFCHPIRRYLHSTAQHRGSTRSTIPLTEKRIAKLEREKIHA